MKLHYITINYYCLKHVELKKRLSKTYFFVLFVKLNLFSKRNLSMNILLVLLNSNVKDKSEKFSRKKYK